MSKPRVRFAPSPSGSLHIGNLRTALFNWLFARRSGGSFILRIEDTDVERSRATHEAEIISSLKRLGLEWDEGPDIGGPFEPYRQSGRGERHAKALEALKEAGAVYPCFCSPDELEAERKALIAAGKPPRYQGKCRNLTATEREKMFAGKGPPSYRFKVEGDAVEFLDGVRGHVSFQTRDIGDFIVTRSSGSASFYLATAVDDLDMKITDVIRGEDHLSNTPEQMLIMRALGKEPPRYHHLSIILDVDGKKLSKRGGALDVAYLLDSGYTPEAVTTAVAMLGWSGVAGDSPESLESMAEKFDIAKVSKAPCRFDEARLDHLNARALKDMPPEKAFAVIGPLLKHSGFPFESFSDDQALRIASAVVDTIHAPSQAPAIAELFTRLPEPDEGALSALSGKEAQDTLIALERALEKTDCLDDEAFHAVIESVSSATGLKGGKLLKPVRAAITGRTKGPGLADLFVILGKEETLNRIRKTLSMLAKK